MIVLPNTYQVAGPGPFVPRETENGFEFVIGEYPKRQVFATSSVVLLAFVAFFIFLFRCAEDPATAWLAVVVAVPTMAALLGIPAAQVRLHRHLGPLLVFDGK